MVSRVALFPKELAFAKQISDKRARKELEEPLSTHQSDLGEHVDALKKVVEELKDIVWTYVMDTEVPAETSEKRPKELEESLSSHRSDLLGASRERIDALGTQVLEFDPAKTSLEAERDALLSQAAEKEGKFLGRIPFESASMLWIMPWRN